MKVVEAAARVSDDNYVTGGARRLTCLQAQVKFPEARHAVKLLEHVAAKHHAHVPATVILAISHNFSRRKKGGWGIYGSEGRI
jgi:hypothetical protein